MLQMVMNDRVTRLPHRREDTCKNHVSGPRAQPRSGATRPHGRACRCSPPDSRAYPAGPRPAAASHPRCAATAPSALRRRRRRGARRSLLALGRRLALGWRLGLGRRLQLLASRRVPLTRLSDRLEHAQPADVDANVLLQEVEQLRGVLREVARAVEAS